MSSVLTGRGSVLTMAGDDDGGNIAETDTLAIVYARGLAGTPAVDNLMTGSYFGVYIDVDGSIKVRQITLDDGSGADSNAPLLLRRLFSNSAAAGLIADYRVRYTDVVNIRAGLQEKFTVEDVGGTARLYMVRREGLATGSTKTMYRPVFAGGEESAEQLDLIGFHQNTPYAAHGRDGNGLIWHRAQMTDTVREMFAIVSQMDSEGGGNPTDGSILSHAVTGPSSSIGLGTQLTRIRHVLDAGNFGSERADAHIELMAASDDAGDVVTGLEVYADRAEVPGNLVVGGAASVGATLSVGGVQQSNDLLWVSGTTGAVDMLVAGAHAVNLPVVPGKRFVLNSVRHLVRSRTGTATGTYDYNVGTNGPTYNNMQSFTGVAVGNFNTAAVPFSFTASANPTQFPAIDAANQIFFNVVTPIAGASVLTAEFILFGWYVSA